MSDSDASSRSGRTREREFKPKRRRSRSPERTIFGKTKKLLSNSSPEPEMDDSASSASIRRVEGVESVLLEVRNIVSTTEEIRSHLESIIQNVKDGLVDWVNAHVAFTGFDALEMRKRIVSKLKVGDIFLLIVVGLTRGNNIQRISSCMRNPQTKKQFDSAVKTARIQKNVSGDYSAITLSRIVACFPDAVSQLLYDHEISMAVDYGVLLKLHPEYPKVARHQICASVLPEVLEGDHKARALSVIMVPYMMTCEVINSKNKAWKSLSSKQKVDDSEKYLFNSYSSKVLGAGERKDLASKLGITTSNGRKLTTVWYACSEKARQWLESNYGYTLELD